MMAIPGKNEYILFHTIYGYLDVISYNVYQNLKNGNFEGIRKSIFKLLMKHSYVLDYSTNEKELLVQLLENYEKNRCHEKKYYIIFSYDCNFDCVYCFEKDKEGGLLSKEALFRILEIVKRKNENNNSKIILYGGEPLLLQNYEMIKIVLRFAKEEGIKIKIITNGYCLDLFINLFIKYEEVFDSILITIDGEKEQHDKTRVKLNREGTYDKIMKNIGLAEENKLPVEIRVNVSVDNYRWVKSFLEKNEVCKNHRVFVYFIEDNRNLNGGLNVLKNRNNLLIELFNVCSNRNNMFLEYSPLKQLDSMINKNDLILPLFDYCDSDNIVLFDEDCKMYNCAEACGDKRLLLREGYHNYFTNDENCKNCNLACICGGGCKWQREKNYEKCKANMKSLIEMFIRNKLEKLDYDI